MSTPRARPWRSTGHVTRTGERGFTLIELIIVLSIIGLLVGLGLPQYKSATIKAREAVLKENLFILRKLIDQYAQDKGKYPASIQALVQDSYLRTIPIDPMTRQSTTWVEVRELPSPEDPMLNEVPGVIDVKSGSEDKSPIDGSPYNTW
ncbi:MAG: prepilin-type N-terminal cleavage/methylation domain-containing protein [Candidatus Aminicenantes bacterium]|jgi:general secretion pathway protein G|nr:prepilin-type N-terminal cleavage/methylation domain-containing protein [Candidatus Aminicenantes bacterium]